MKWIRVGDMIPETHKAKYLQNTYTSNAILVTDGKHIEIGYMERTVISGNPNDIWHGGPNIDVVTHWMPLPELPK